MNPARNAPCPCGSGKKYKNCCLKRLVEKVIARRSSVELALRWLERKYSTEIAVALEAGFYRVLDAPAVRELHKMSGDERGNVLVNALEWVLAEGVLHLDEGGGKISHRAMSLVLGPGGPRLSPLQRDFLESIGREPLRLYEVQESRAGEGLVLKDLLDAERPAFWVEERTGSRRLVRWDVIGARAVPVGDIWWLSGAIYAFGAARGQQLLERIQEAIAQARALGHAYPPRLLSEAIIDSWLEDFTAPIKIPHMVDQGTGEPFVMVTDHYQVADWDRLARALESQPDVEGDRVEGWTRFVELGGDMRRSLLAINIGKDKDRLEPFARTIRLGNEGRTWLESLAGDAIRFLKREVVDPRDVLSGKRRPADPGRSDAAPARSPEHHTEALQQIHERLYRNWADEPIPALGDRTPRQAASTPEGRESLVRLLKEYESMEERRAREEGRAPVDFGFLWNQVGLERASMISV